MQADFLEKEVEIKNRESPDFLVKYLEQELYIEAGSVRVEHRKNKSHLNKIYSTIIKKNKKPYANKNTVLILDITSVLYNDELVDGYSFLERYNDFESIIFNLLKDNKVKYGAIVLVGFGLNRAEKRYEALPRRMILDDCSNLLISFMDNYYPGKKGEQKRRELSS